MGIDALLKRFFPAVVLALIGLAAYFQASGMGQLVASSVAVDPSSVPTTVGPSKHVQVPLPASTDHVTSGAAILSRNPFDSVTGPLDAKPAPADELDVAPPPDNSGDPEDDPYCDAVKVILITWSEDPSWSFAALAGGDGKSILRRIGDDLNGYKVHDIGWDTVWLMSGANQRCRVIVGGRPPPGRTVSAGSPAAEPAPAPTTTSRSSRRGKVPPEIASKIHKISDTHFEVERTVIDQVLEKQADLMRSVRVVPAKDGDKSAGLQLYGIRPDSLLGMLGLENGDQLQSVNGFDIHDPQKALEAYTRLRASDQLTVSIVRRGKPTNIDVNIK
ncbi:MAG: type II secretion system protein GspC [Polyangiaceae bacterium]